MTDRDPEPADGGPPTAVQAEERRNGARRADDARAAGTAVVRAEASLYASTRAIQEEHELDALGIAFYDAQTTLQWSYNADAWFHAASTMKLAVLLGVFHEVEKGRLRLDEPVHVRNKFRSVVSGEAFALDLGRDADSVVYASLGRTMPVEKLAYQMITTSSNFATNLLVDVVGVPAIQAALAALGISGLRVLRGVEDQAAYDAGVNNEVTANGLLALLRAIAEHRACSPEASKKMLAIMFDQRFKSGIPAGVPPVARVAHKTGNITTVHHDAGIVYLDGRKPYVLVVLTQFAPDKGRGEAVAAVARDIHESLAEIT